MVKFLMKSSIVVFSAMILSIIVFAVVYFVSPEGSSAVLISSVDDNKIDQKNYIAVPESRVKDWRLYRNSEFEFEFKYPSEWLAKAGNWNQEVDLIFDEKNKNVISAYVYARKISSEEKDSFQETIRENVLNIEPGIIGAIRISNSIIKNDSQTIGYFSKWKLYFLNSKGQKVYKIHIRSDFESKIKTIKRNSDYYKTVYSFVLNPTANSREELFAKILSTFETF